MSTNILRIATRKSPLALWQANFVRDALMRMHPNLAIELLPMSTSGDTFIKDKLLDKGGKGLFVKELEDALLTNRADIAVHSMKDVPSYFPQGLSLGAICSRDNPMDALVSHTYKNLQNLPLGAVVGTSSLRRQSQLLALRPDLNIKLLRGNIHTRLKKLEALEYDAIILAAAGLERMQLQQLIREILDEKVMVPACGQGALGIECRSDDRIVLERIQPLNDHLTATCVLTERHVNALLGGNCHIPVGIYCKPLADATLHLQAMVASANGQTILRTIKQGPQTDGETLAIDCATTLLNKGAARLIAGDTNYEA